MEVRLDPDRWRGRRGMAALLDALGSGQGLTRYVGGAVRDELLHLPCSDVDLATRLRPEEVIARLENAGIKAVPTGIDHGTITAISDGQTVEVTTLRRDLSTDGRRATVDFTDDWREDAARRDFTINALSADPVTGEVFDYFGGLADLEARRIRFIGNPMDRIAEDHLRILRFFRFHARFGAGEPDQEALDACTKRANDLMALSRERIADELLKLLALPAPAATVEVMIDRDILRPVLPEIASEAPPLLQALVENEETGGIAPDALRRLASLLPREPLLAEKLAARLKLSNKARKRLACAVTPDLGPSPQGLAYRAGRECAVDRLLLANRVEEAAAIAGWTVPKLPLGGGVLIARGLTEGPVVARTLRAIEDHWVSSGFPRGEELDRIVSDAVAEARKAR